MCQKNRPFFGVIAHLLRFNIYLSLTKLGDEVSENARKLHIVL